MDGATQPAITPGSKWMFNDGSPFPPKGTMSCTVIEARDGWVRYDLAHVPDQRCRVDTFLQLYVPAPGQQAAA